MPNYVIFDLAYHWGCFGGHLLVDFEGSHFPSSDYRRRFLRRYLQESHKAEQIELSKEEFDCELEDLFHRVSLAAVGHVLKWCIFAHVFEVEKDVSSRRFDTSSVNGWILIKFTQINSFPLLSIQKLLKNAESIAAREKDPHFCGKYALNLYRTFSELYPQVLEDALEHFEKRS